MLVCARKKERRGSYDCLLYTSGKEVKKKSLAEIAMAYGYVYVAQIAMGAKPAQTIKAITEAEACLLYTSRCV